MAGILDVLGGKFNQIGKAGVHALMPNDFEYYAVTLELTEFDGTTIEYLTFPVTPSAINYDDTKATNIKKSFAGVTALDTESFVPKKISLTGMFGRKLRLLIGTATPSIQSSSQGVFNGLKEGGLQLKTSVLNAKLKTGYGTTKLLESIITKSSHVDAQNRPNKLFLYIPPLGHNFLVKVDSLNLSQDYTSSNMLWKYGLNLTALARVEDLDTLDGRQTSLIKVTALDVLQRSANLAVNSIKSTIF
jgi:ATP-dependent Clp protease ATP-binding subunit ClpA